MKAKILIIRTSLFLFASFTLPAFVSAQDLYGMTELGGANDKGVLFKFNPATSTYSKKIDFALGPNGNSPQGSLVRASDGNFYGMMGGGVNFKGVLFQFNPSTSTYTKVLDFAGESNGALPHGSLIQASDGNLYGMTQAGGTGPGFFPGTGIGVLFQFNPSTSVYTKRIDFLGPNGASPVGSLIQASDGNLYGMTNSGGTSNSGVLFQFNPSTSAFAVKVNFTGPNGLVIQGSLIQASDGNLYGMTAQGGTNNKGILFQFNPSTSAYSILVNFAGVSNGATPYGSLMQASNGNLYGMTSEGGANNFGVLFRFNPSTSTYTKEFDFAGVSSGASPHGSLMQASDGNLYGMTQSGGTGTNGGLIPDGAGVLFQFNPSTSAFTKELDFTGANGRNPLYTNLVEISQATTSVPTLSQWGLITLSVLVLGVGVFFVRGRMV